jgi:hypothetical protein
MKNIAIFGALFFGLVLAMIAPLGHAQAPSLLIPNISSVPPEDEAEDSDFAGGNPIDFFDAYSWRLFIALNWPAADNKRGEPDTNRSIGDVIGPRVWETWKSASEAIPADGSPPTEWSSFDAVTLCKNEAGGQAGLGPVKVLAFAMPGPVFEDFNQVSAAGMPVGALVARNRSYVRYEIRMNQKQFDHIRTHRLNLRKTLDEMPADSPARVFPDTSIEIKAAWRELKSPGDDAIAARYYNVQARGFNPETKNCETKRFGLIGLHIVQKTKNRRQWTWSTFEHVDNLSLGAGAPAGAASTLEEVVENEVSLPDGGVTAAKPPKLDPESTKVHRFLLNSGEFTTIPPSKTAATNAKWHAQPEIAGSVWKNYFLVMTQWPTQIGQEAGTGSPFPTKNVANVTLETYKNLQASSCIGCHFPTKESFGTDFVWFVGLRAFPVPPAVPPGGAAPGSAKSKAFIEKLNKAAEEASKVPSPVDFSK